MLFNRGPAGSSARAVHPSRLEKDLQRIKADAAIESLFAFNAKSGKPDLRVRAAPSATAKGLVLEFSRMIDVIHMAKGFNRKLGKRRKVDGTCDTRQNA